MSEAKAEASSPAVEPVEPNTTSTGTSSAAINAEASNDSAEQIEARRKKDRKRLKEAARRHGLAALALLSLWGAADAWYLTSGMMLATVLSVVNAVVAARMLSSLLHEWGHFAGARLAASYSPIVPDVRGFFMFGFNFAKNTREQFIAMSIGGIAASWLFALLAFAILPLDNPGRIALFATALGSAISVIIFEGPITANAMRGEDPEKALQTGLNNGSGDKGRVIGYGIGLLIFLIAI